MARRQELTDRQTAHICRGLALQLHAGITLADGLYLLAEDAESAVAGVLREMACGLDRGSGLPEVLEQADCFPDYVCSLVHIGQSTGRLEKTLQSLAEFYDRRSRQKRQIKNALGYPAVVFMLMIAVVTVLLVKVLPIFDGVYASLGSRMTGVAAGLLQLGGFLKRAMPVLLGALALCVAAGFAYWKSAFFREWVNSRYRESFGDRGIGRKFNNARFAEALAMGLTGGLTLEEAMLLAKNMLKSDPGAVARCDLCIRGMADGAGLAGAMKEAQLLPPAESRLLAVGLRAGNADRVMEQIAQRLQEQAEDALEDAVSKIEPTMVLVASLLVGTILLSVMLPLMNIMSTIG